MNIQEAVKKSLETGRNILRKDSVFFKKDVLAILIEPTNGEGCCIIHISENGKETRAAKRWSPNAEDLVSNRWELAD